jgi:imidazole glycerol-phosphate synthase subunit HisH
MIGIINYGVGNIKAFLNIYHKLQIPSKVISCEDDFEGIDKLILPGVGAFDHVMSTFNQSGLRDLTEKYVMEDRIPVIGVCVGMQMLAESSDEGKLAGLGWIGGNVKRFDESRISYETHLPHMGWNDVRVVPGNPLFKNLDDSPKYYFLHSYYFEAKEEDSIIASAHYGYEFTCAVQKRNIYGVQFHPEKSHKYGSIILENFAKL